MIKLYGETACRMLKIQYRMNTKIMNYSSKSLYEGKLIADESVASHTLKDLEKVEKNNETNEPILFIDTTNCDFVETSDEEGSKANIRESEIVVNYIEKLLSFGVSPSDIGVITPYNAQVEFLREKIRKDHQNIEISSVDGFQGREKEVIIISMVRSNSNKEVGFLKDDRRINVAVKFFYFYFFFFIF